MVFGGGLFEALAPVQVGLPDFVVGDLEVNLEEGLVYGHYLE